MLNTVLEKLGLSKSLEQRFQERQAELEAQNLTRLKDWFNQVADYIEQDIAIELKKKSISQNQIDEAIQRSGMRTNMFMSLKQSGRWNLSGNEYVIDIDPKAFSQDDLLVLSDEFKALHDVCVGYNIAIEFGGFDKLPRDKTSFASIEFDFTRHYDCHQHPDYTGVAGDEKRFEDELNNKSRDLKL